MSCALPIIYTVTSPRLFLPCFFVMLLRPQPIMHIMHSHSTNAINNSSQSSPQSSSMYPASPLSPWGTSALTVPPNTPTTSTPSSHPYHPNYPSHPNANARHHPHHPPSASPTEIIPRLYLSDLADAENPALLASLRITHVFSAMPGFVNIPTNTLHSHPHSQNPLPGPTPIHRFQIHIEDNPFAELAAHLPSSTAFISNALLDPNANVLVHCVQGISRSASVVSAFLMAVYGWTPAQAVAYVKKKRCIAEPNFGFVAQLHEYEKTLLQQRGQGRVSGQGQGHAR